MEFLQILLYVLGAILLGVIIVLVVKLIISVDRINSILDSINKKLFVHHVTPLLKTIFPESRNDVLSKLFIPNY